jgi:hypothetical protein
MEFVAGTFHRRGDVALTSRFAVTSLQIGARTFLGANESIHYYLFQTLRFIGLFITM